MAEDFNFSEDSSSVLWKETFQHNAMRVFGAGVVWFLILALTGTGENPLVMLIALPVVYVIVLLPVGLIASWLSSIPFVGLFAAFASFLVAVGDPLIFGLSKFKPEWVPLQKPDFFSLRVVHFVTSPFEQ